MRIYKDLELVEQLGSGVPRISQVYPKEYFILQIILPAEEDVTPQVEYLLKIFEGTQYRSELQEKLNLSDREYFRKNYLKPDIEE